MVISCHTIKKVMHVIKRVMSEISVMLLDLVCGELETRSGGQGYSCFPYRC
jgi:hypothetical protein